MDQNKHSKTESKDKILALIPAYNESDRIKAVIEGARAHLPVLVVDDGSVDETAAVAERAGAEVLRQEPNQGKGAALRAGFRYALEKGYEAVLTLDADGQHAPDEIPKFMEAYRQNHADLIIGQRDFSQMPPLRRLANTTGRWGFSWALGRPVADNQSGYRLIGRELMEATLESEEGGFEFEVEMIVVCVNRGLALDWTPIRTIYAGETSHINGWEHTVNFIRLLRSVRRMRRMDNTRRINK